MRDRTLDICRACHHPGESLGHVTSGCSRLANSEYLHRHNLITRIIHQQLALKYGLVSSEVPYYQYKPEPILDNGQYLLYWDRSIMTDRTIVANKPDIVIVDRSARRALIVDVAIPHDENLVKAEKEKQIKYIDLAHEVTAMWNLDSTIIVPIVVSVNGLITKSLDRHLERLSLGIWVKNPFSSFQEFGFQALPCDQLPAGRLTGGHEAWPHSHPYIVSLQLRIFGLRVHYCGGSLLNQVWVLTAGHCVKVSWIYQWFLLDIAAGAHNIDYHDMMTQFRTVEKRVPHPQYAGGINEFDIALLKVNLPFVFTSAVQPVRLPDRISTHYKNLMLVGWGALKTTYFLPAMPQLLQEVKVTYISYKDCYRAFQDIEEKEAELLLKENVHICTGPLYGGVAACSGDSGGPLIQYVYANSNTFNTDFNFNLSIEDEYEVTGDENYTTPSSFWSRLQEMIEKYISPRETVINSIDRKEETTVNTNQFTDDTDKAISKRQTNEGIEIIPVVVGVVSWGISPCGYKGAPSVYTNVSYYMDFIKKYFNT